MNYVYYPCERYISYSLSQFSTKRFKLGLMLKRIRYHKLMNENEEIKLITKSMKKRK